MFVMGLLWILSTVHADSRTTREPEEPSMVNGTLDGMLDVTTDHQYMNSSTTEDKVGQAIRSVNHSVTSIHPSEETNISITTTHHKERSDEHNKETTVKSTKQTITDSTGCYQIEIFVHCFVGVFAIFGIIGNSLSIRILQRIKTNASSSLLLSALAFWDSAFLVSIIVMKPVIGILSYFAYVPTVQMIMVYLFAYGFEFVGVTLRQCTWVTALLTVHRYIGNIKIKFLS